MDTHAGAEHFGRALARGFEHALVIVDRSYNALQVGVASARLAADLGISRVHLAVNRVGHEDDLDRVEFIIDELGGFEFASIHALPYDERALECEPGVDGLLAGSALGHAVEHLADHFVETAESVA